MLENKVRTKAETERYLAELREWIAKEEDTPAEEMAAFFAKRLANYEDVHLRNWGELYAHIADFLDGSLDTLLDALNDIQGGYPAGYRLRHRIGAGGGVPPVPGGPGHRDRPLPGYAGACPGKICAQGVPGH